MPFNKTFYYAPNCACIQAGTLAKAAANPDGSLPARHCQIGFAPTFTTDLSGNKIDQITGFYLPYKILDTPAVKLTLSPSTTARTTAHRPSLFFQLICISRKDLESTSLSLTANTFTPARSTPGR